MYLKESVNYKKRKLSLWNITFWYIIRIYRMFIAKYPDYKNEGIFSTRMCVFP